MMAMFCLEVMTQASYNNIFGSICNEHQCPNIVHKCPDRPVADLATPSDLGSHACVIFPTDGEEGKWQFADSEGEHTVTVSGRLRVNSMEAAAQAVRDGVGVSVLPDYAIRQHLASGEVQRVLTGYDIKSGHQIYALYPHRHHLSAKVRVFIDYLLAALGNDD
jgi:DNA-binding transcriptional LysR family regulator